MFDDGASVSSLILTHVHAIDAARVSSNTSIAAIQRILTSMNATALEVWHLRDWTFRYLPGTMTLTVAAGNDQALPVETVWVNEGKQGGLWRVGEPKGRVVWRPLQVVNDLILTQPDEQGPPLYYSVYGRILRVWPKPSANFNVAFVVLPAMPEISDQAAPADGLSLFSQAARYCVYLGAAAKELRRKGDLAEYGVWKADFESAKTDLCITEHQGLPESGDMPRYAGSADVWPNLDE